MATGSGVERATILSNGRFGIGNSSPADTLSVHNTAAAGTVVGGFYMPNATSGNVSIFVGEAKSNGNGMYIGHRTTDGMALIEPHAQASVMQVGGSNVVFQAANVEKARITSTGMGIGTASPNASALLDVSSTTQGLLMPRMTTAQKNAITTPATGLSVYDTDLLSVHTYNGTAWSGSTG